MLCCRRHQPSDACQMAGTGPAEQQRREQEVQRAHQHEANTKRAAEADRQQRKQEAEAKQKVGFRLCSAVGGLSWSWSPRREPAAFMKAFSKLQTGQRPPSLPPRPQLPILQLPSHRASFNIGTHLQAAEVEHWRQQEAQREQEVKRAQEEQKRKQREAEEASLHCLCCPHELLF